MKSTSTNQEGIAGFYLFYFGLGFLISYIWDFIKCWRKNFFLIWETVYKRVKLLINNLKPNIHKISTSGSMTESIQLTEWSIWFVRRDDMLSTVQNVQHETSF